MKSTWQKHIVLSIVFIFVGYCLNAQSESSNIPSFKPGETWVDTEGNVINAHGGGVLYDNGVYYWYGEHRPDNGFVTERGIMCYSSTDLYHWKNEGIVMALSSVQSSPIVKGCIIERPKVIFNHKTGKYILYFHLELKNKGYEAAQVGVAVSDSPVGPFSFLKSSRVNAGKWPLNLSKEQIALSKNADMNQKWWTPKWSEAIKNGMFVSRDFKGGQMSRDMTLYVDDDRKAYHIYSSEDNLTLHIAELTDDYLNYTGRFVRIDPAGHNEAPAIFKKDGKYYLITSGCTGWAPNAARLLVADNILGDWSLNANPCVGLNADLTFHSQGTFILPVQGRKDAFIFMADRWNSKSLSDSRYVWLPISMANGMPEIKWQDKWSLDYFEASKPDSTAPRQIEGYSLLWSDEFNKDGLPDTTIWSFENGFARNEELQWYQQGNSFCRNGVLVITAKKEQKANPMYRSGANTWREKRKQIEYTSASIKTEGKKEFQYGRFEVRAKIPTANGAWPAIWTLGTKMEWPSNGEIDIMEYYRINGIPHILANVAWGTDRRFEAQWDSQAIPFSHFTAKDPAWADKFHLWRMDWDDKAIRLYLDDELLNETLLSETGNGALGAFKNPFQQSHYVLLNLAIGGIHGGEPDTTAFPMQYMIDYVRVYKKTE